MIGNIRDDLIYFMYKNQDKSIKKQVDMLLEVYNITKKPVKSCSECIHYKKVQPGEITYVGKHFPNIESCSMGHEPGFYIADFCTDYFSTKTTEIKI